MAVPIFDIHGKKGKTIAVPKMFHTKVREDIVHKYFEADKLISPYRPYAEAGRRHSAAGTISHKRHDWKGHYGRGISRIPRKTMWRRGTQFYWIGAEISGTRGGRRAHPPRGIGKEKKINKKEMEIAMHSAFAATAHAQYVLNRYATLKKYELEGPVVVSSAVVGAKTKDLMQMLKTMYHDAFRLVRQEKVVRAGKGKLRGRRYKANAGLLLVTGKDETVKANGITIKKVNEVRIADLYPLGRLTAYTEKAVEELGK